MSSGPSSEKEETVSEWKEGPHKVIERCGGVGEDVEVEVVKNFYAASEADELSSAFHTNIHKLRHTPHDVEKDAEKAGEAVRHGCKELGHKLKDVVSPPSSPANGNRAGGKSDSMHRPDT